MARVLNRYVRDWVAATDRLDEATRIGGPTLTQAALEAVEARDAYLAMLEAGDG